MTSLLWIPATLAAAALQTARNATQRSLTEAVGVMGATQARFVFGLPFALLFLALSAGLAGAMPPAVTQAALWWCLAGSVAQILATALMLAAMRQRSFAVTTACVKTEPAQVAVFAAIALGDPLGPGKLAAILLATAGVIVLTVRPGQGLTDGGWRPILLGVAAGAFFGLAAVCFRGAILALESGGPVLRASTILAVSLALQAAICLGYLLAVDRKALTGSLQAWRPSLAAGFLGAAASQFWFIGFALTSAANVRTLALVEVFMAQIASRRLFAERIGWREGLGMAMVTAGVGAVLILAR